MTNQTSTIANPIVKLYFYVGIRETLGGSGEYVASIQRVDKLYTNVDLAIKAYGTSEYVSTDDTGWRDHSDIELVECISDITGNVDAEPEILVAMRGADGKVIVFGINTVFGVEQRDGADIEFLPLEAYPRRSRGGKPFEHPEGLADSISMRVGET